MIHTMIQTKEMLRKIPNHGIGYGVLVYCSLEKLPKIQTNIAFNYLGEFAEVKSDKNGFAISMLSTGLDSSNENDTFKDMIINASSVAGQLNFHVTFNEASLTEQRMVQIIGAYQDSLRKII